MENFANLHALEPGELEFYVSSMSPSVIESIGSKSWIEWHIRLQKLQQQAVIEISGGGEEATKEAIISHGMIPVLVHEAISISLWRQKILPRILKAESELPPTFLLYAALYHETVAVGILEIVLFDEEACSSISDILVDIIDYAMEMITSLYKLISSGYLDKISSIEPPLTAGTPLEEFKCQQEELLYDIGMRCVTIISCLCNVMSSIHISATSRLYETHDTISLICELIQLTPWQSMNSSGEVMCYTDGKWKKVKTEELDKVCRSETMCWLALWRLLLNPNMPNYYQINNARKTQLCKLLCRMTDVMLDQIPVLVDLKRSLGQLAVAEIPTANPTTSKPLLIEVVPQIRKSILKKIKNKTMAIANNQLEKFFKTNKDDLIEAAKLLTPTYTSEILEHIDDGGAKCASCGDKAVKKCSRCRIEWYCGRECQVKGWPKHKGVCDQYSQLAQ